MHFNRRRALATPLFAAGALASARAFAQPAAIGDVNEPLGICLEGWPYPGPVSFLPLTMAGEALRMAYMDFAPTGAPNGQAILLLHGKNFDSSYWAGPIDWLRKAGFRVVVPDQIGFNKSSKPLINYTFEALAANTLALADKLGLEKFAVLGHSTGGMLAVRLTTLYPERVTRLILEDPIGLLDYRLIAPPQSLATLEATEHKFTPETYRAFVARYFPLLPPAQYEPFVVWRLRMAQSGDYERFVAVVALTYQMIYNDPVIDLLPALKSPVLLAVGAQDKSVPFAAYAPAEMRPKIPTLTEAAHRAIAAIPQGRLVEFANVGHVPHLEAPEDFARAALAFLQG